MTPEGSERSAAAPVSGLSRRTLALYALPAFALSLPTIPVYVYLPTLYAQDLGLGLAATGFVLLIARIFDVVTDPIMGIASDRYRFRWGRRKPWILVGTVFAAFALIKLFDPPDGIGVGYLLLWVIVLFTGWTLVSIAYTAWGAELSDDYHGRARVTGSREGVMIIGVLVAGAIPAIAIASGGSQRDGLAAIAWTAVLIGGPAVALLLWQVRERPLPSHIKAPAVSALGLLRELKSNQPFLRLLTGWFVNGLANGLPSVLFLLYLEYGLGASESERNVLIFVYFLAGVFAIPLWVRLSRSYGKHRVWCWAMLLACAAFVWVPLLEPGDLGWFALICVVTGMALGADLALPPAMQADVVDLDSLRTRSRRAGLFFALWSMSTKLALACAVGVAFPLLAAAGFETGTENSREAILALAVIYAVVPSVLKLCAVAVIWRHPLTAHRQSIIRRRLDALASRAGEKSHA
jgi:Na+/melibiose symporter-like transporter